MTYRLVYPESYNRRAKKFFRRHPGLIRQYQKTLELLEIDPLHSSLRLHKLQGRLSDLSSISINMSYRILLYFAVQGDDIVLVDIGSHEKIY